MNRTERQIASDAETRLTPQSLLQCFGAASGIARKGVFALFDALGQTDAAAMSLWTPFWTRWAGRATEQLPKHLARWAKHYNAPGDAGRLLFALQTYYALAVETVAARFGHAGVDRAMPGNPFAWPHAARSKTAAALAARLQEACGAFHTVASLLAEGEECDLFKPLYQNLFPRPLRRQLGEYYTPDWLAAHVLDQVGYRGLAGQRLLDPACGSGTFLIMALRRCLAAELAPRGASPAAPHPPIVGFDLNPLAVMTARANYAVALADRLPNGAKLAPPVYLHDSILDRGEADGIDAKNFDFVVGNPPWIAWDNLSEEDRQATKPLWERYGLFSLSGNEARHGGGKKDLSMLMLYAAADRYLLDGGRLGMVITQTLFQTKGAGDGFRRFRLGDAGKPLAVLRVDDMVALRPFGDASNWTSVVVLEKGAATEYPVPYFQWGRGARDEGSEIGPLSHWERARVRAACGFATDRRLPPVACLARPVDPARPTSPWMVEEQNAAEDIANGKPQAACALPADYTAHLGANSGGANGVYWVQILEHSADGVCIRNLAAKGKHQLETVKCTIEPDLLHPLLRWGDVKRYAAAPSAYLLLAQNPITRTGIPESTMQEKYPRTLAYLEQFHDLLVARSAFHRYQGRGPFYSMYNVGPYTVAPIKVVWRRMDRRINAAVVAGDGTPAVPQETCVLTACDSLDEAHYLCAMLNSDVLNRRVASHSVCGGKSFGTPGMFDFLPLRRYDAGDARHAELSALSGRAHAAASASRAEVSELQHRIDRLAEELWRNAAESQAVGHCRVKSG